MRFKIFGQNWRPAISGIITFTAFSLLLVITDDNSFIQFLPNKVEQCIIIFFRFIAFISGIIFAITVKDSSVTGGSIAQTKEAGKRIKQEIKQDTQYSTKIETPIYEPKNKKPFLLELVDTTKSDQLIEEIICADIPNDEKKFLIEAAKRHNVFDYEKIADYYSHSSEKIQYLMEKSALVIIDFGKAIENGYVKLCDEIKNRYLKYTD